MKRVDLYKFSAKRMLRSYPDERGNPLMRQPSAQAALAPEAFRKSLGRDCCELMRRPTMGVNLCAASIDGAALRAPMLQEKLGKLSPKITAEDFCSSTSLTMWTGRLRKGQTCCASAS